MNTYWDKVQLVDDGMLYYYLMWNKKDILNFYSNSGLVVNQEIVNQ